MPNITIEGPSIDDLDTKRTLVREVTDAASRAFGLDKRTVVVLLKANRPEDVGVGGDLLVDRQA